MFKKKNNERQFIPHLKERDFLPWSIKIKNPVMGVPITFLDKYCPNQFRIIGCTESEGKGFSNGLWNGGVTQPMVDNKRIYKRLFIQKV